MTPINIKALIAIKSRLSTSHYKMTILITFKTIDYRITADCIEPRRAVNIEKITCEICTWLIFNCYDCRGTKKPFKMITNRSNAQGDNSKVTWDLHSPRRRSWSSRWSELASETRAAGVPVVWANSFWLLTATAETWYIYDIDVVVLRRWRLIFIVALCI